MESARPHLPATACARCGQDVDPLRAPRVAFFATSLRFFCSLSCYETFAESPLKLFPTRPEPLPARADRSWRQRTLATVRAAVEGEEPDREVVHAPLPVSGPSPFAPALCAAAAFVVAALPGSLWSVGLVVLFALLGLASSLWGMPARNLRNVEVWAPALGVVFASLALWVDQLDGSSAWLTRMGPALAVVATLLRLQLDRRGQDRLQRALAQVQRPLPATVWVAQENAHGGSTASLRQIPLAQLKVGDELRVSRGEVVPADGVVRSGRATLEGFVERQGPLPCEVGDAVLAGARVREGEIRIIASKVAQDCTLARMAELIEADQEPPFVLGASRLVARFGPLLLAILALAGWWTSAGRGWTQILGMFASLLLVAPLLGLRRAAAFPLSAAIASMGRRGIVLESLDALDRAGRTHVVALAAHGAITTDRPEVVEFELLEGSEHEASALVGMALSAEDHAAPTSPIGRAIVDHAKDLAASRTPLRRELWEPGRGVLAHLPDDQLLLLGNRQFLLAHGASVAAAETRAAAFEARGLSALFLALNGRVRAVWALRYESRAGARAALQRLFDLRVELVLISGDHRATVAELARTLDVTHVKAELRPDEKAEEVRRLKETGSLVAAVAPLRRHESFLSAADVAIVLDIPNAVPDEAYIGIASRDLRDATAALWIAQGARRLAWRNSLWVWCWGGMLTLAATLGLLFPALASLAALTLDVLVLPSNLRFLRRLEAQLGRGV